MFSTGGTPQDLPILTGIQRRTEGLTTFVATFGDIDLDVYHGEILAYVGTINADDMFEVDVSYRPGNPDRADVQIPLLENERVPSNRCLYGHIFPLGNFRLSKGKVRFSYAKAIAGNSARFEIAIINLGGIL